MIKIVKHSRTSLSRLGVLERRARYIENAAHRHHRNKRVVGVRNMRCLGESLRALVVSVELRFEDYLFARAGKCGKRTARKWLEIIYSSPLSERRDGEGNVIPCLDKRERNIVEEAMFAGLMSGCLGRLGWHVDIETGRCDMHIVASSINDRNRPWINDGFGHGGKNLKLELERIEERALHAINRDRAPEHRILTPREVHTLKRKKSGKQTLAEKLAKAAWDGEVSSLPAALIKLGYQIAKQTAKKIWVQATESKKTIAYRLATLHINWRLARAKLPTRKQAEPTPKRPDQRDHEPS